MVWYNYLLVPVVIPQLHSKRQVTRSLAQCSTPIYTIANPIFALGSSTILPSTFDCFAPGGIRKISSFDPSAYTAFSEPPRSSAMGSSLPLSLLRASKLLCCWPSSASLISSTNPTLQSSSRTSHTHKLRAYSRTQSAPTNCNKVAASTLAASVICTR